MRGVYSSFLRGSTSSASVVAVGRRIRESHASSYGGLRVKGDVSVVNTVKYICSNYYKKIL